MDKQGYLMDTISSSPDIKLQNMTVHSGQFCVLKDITATFPGGKCSVILGVAGSGKSSLIKSAAGLLVPTEGRVMVDTLDINNASKKQALAFRGMSGFVFQDSALWQDTSALQNVSMPLRIHQPGLDSKIIYTLVSSLFRKVGFTDDPNLRPADLSTGEQKLISLARAIIHQPRILYMDDPTSNLDEDSIDNVYGIIEEQKNENTTILIGTNNSDIAYRYADYLGVIKGGKLLVFGPYEETLNKVEHILSGSLARLRARGSRNQGSKDEL